MSQPVWTSGPCCSVPRLYRRDISTATTATAALLLLVTAALPRATEALLVSTTGRCLHVGRRPLWSGDDGRASAISTWVGHGRRSRGRGWATEPLPSTTVPEVAEGKTTTSDEPAAKEGEEQDNETDEVTLAETVDAIFEAENFDEGFEALEDFVEGIFTPDNIGILQPEPQILKRSEPPPIISPRLLRRIHP